ncbi:MAG: hypothetical protein MJ094_07200 [Saccharofermentans sp.]|nr:hypothetical protein [Saccharofermentans sp.]
MRNKIKLSFNGYYIKKLKESYVAIIICAFFSIVITLISYPGFFYTDSEQRIQLALQLWDSIKAIINGNPIESSSWLTVTPQYFIMLSLKLTGSVGLYTFLQAFLAYFSAYLLLKKANLLHHVWLTIVLFCCPFFFCNGVFYEAGVGCLIGIIFLYLYICSFNKLQTKFDYFVWIINMLFWSFVVFGFRANALTILPVVILLIILNIKNIWKYIGIGLVFLGLMATVLLPKALHIDTAGSGSAGLVWETILTIQNIPADRAVGYYLYLDDIGGEGSTAYAITNVDNRYVNSLLISRFGLDVLSKPGVSKIAVTKYLDLLRLEPSAWIQTRMYMLKSTLGINEPLVNIAWIYDQGGRMARYGFNDSGARVLFYWSYIKSVEWFNVCLRPYVLYLVGLVLGALALMLKKLKKIDLNLVDERWLYILAVFYYGAFCVNTQSFELRYFYPAFILLLIAEMSAVTKIIYTLIKKASKSI